MKIVCLVNGEIKTYSDFTQVPGAIDNVIEFVPDYIEGPHTEEEHEILHQQAEMLKQLLKRETN